MELCEKCEAFKLYSISKLSKLNFQDIDHDTDNKTCYHHLLYYITLHNRENLHNRIGNILTKIKLLSPNYPEKLKWYKNLIERYFRLLNNPYLSIIQRKYIIQLQNS